MYAKGMSTRYRQTYVEKIYRLDISPKKISKITNFITIHAKEWQSRPLNEIYPIVFLEAIHKQDQEKMENYVLRQN